MIMKKMILMLAVAVSSLTAFAGGDEGISQKVQDAFKNDFTTAKNVEWMEGANYYRAAFLFNDKHVFAFYSTEGELLGITRYISPDDLPISLQVSLKSNYEGYWISDLFEMSKNDATNYFITVEKADVKIMLKSAGGKWEVFKTEKKA
jgi:hypothetical protein